MSPSLGNRGLRVGELLHPLKALLTEDDHRCNSGAALSLDALSAKDSVTDVVIATSVPPPQKNLPFEAVNCSDLCS